MFLKKIEIQGFKSFAHKTTMSFEPGMTAIVGPNGSGKSNIADAVRWVLGEQKARSLRGASMQDVIFAGTEFRKPLGFAYVAMTFDNSDKALNVDYNEVTVSRRLFRSGESEYVLNGQNVRLKDIQELFFDTGIGKEGYSIIGQGQVEAIINGKPEDRRGLFDEACGITKFKKRKQVSVKKLEDGKADLIRIGDILHELEKRVGPLEKQSEGAREYLRLRDELKVYELNTFVREADRLLSEIEKTRSDIELVKNDLEDVKQEDAELKERNAELSEKIHDAEELIRKAEEEKHKGELLIQNLESQISVAEAEIRSLLSEKNLLENNKEKLSEDNEKLERNAGEYLRSIFELKQELAGFDLSAVGNLPAGDENLSDIRTGDLAQELDLLLGNLQKEFPGAEGSAEEKGIENDIPDPEDDFSFEEPEWLKAIKNKRDDLGEIKEEEEKNRKWIEKTQKELAELEEESVKLHAVAARKNADCEKVKSRRDALKAIAERYEGYGQSVQSVMQLKKRMPGIHGVVADLITVREKYETAIETALGGRIQNVVTDSENTAKQIIDYLKKNRLGRATFLPLDAVRGKTSEECKEALHEAGCLGIASELVQNDSQYDDIIRQLIGNTLVVDTIDAALKIAGRHRHNLRIVTLEGELLSPGGSIAGGAFKNTANLMSRSREIAKLEDEAAEYERELREALEQAGECDRKTENKKSELEQLKEEQRKIFEKRNSISFGIVSDMKMKLSNLRQSINFMSENVDRILREHCSNLTQMRGIEESLRGHEEEVEKRKTLTSDRTTDIAEIKKGIEKAEHNAQDALRLREEFSGSQNEYFTRKDELSERIVSLEKEQMRLNGSVDRDQQKLDTLTGYIWEEYQTGLTEARKSYDKELGSDSKLKQKVNELKSAIKELGPINIQAIEEYKEVSQRYELTKTQYEDICKAQEVVQGIIQELDEEMKKQFHEQFQLISVEFSKVFSKLFGGGEASLEMVFDEEEGETDELNCGIGIIAQPPGKKLQNMMQLSGGEKALTAIALLFAIQNLKPSPFCLLDEIEAALDDSNVLRFAKYVKAITEKAQFILITHRRGTMEEADRLYGVTMQEKGVTSLVSVDLVSDSVT